MLNQADAGGHLSLQLVGTQCNRDAIGARVFVHLEGRVLRQTLQAGDSFLAQSSKTLHFGLGEAEQIEQVRVVWPDGSEQRVRGVVGLEVDREDARQRPVEAFARAGSGRPSGDERERGRA